MTTERLGKAVIKSLEKMSPSEKATCRKHLEKAFLKKPRKQVIHDDDTEPSGVLAFMVKYKIDLTLANYIDIAFMSTPPDGIEEDGEFLASVPDVILHGPRLVQ
jgi:hypothetical protein